MSTIPYNCSACGEEGAIEYCIRPNCKVKFHDECRDQLSDAVRMKFLLNRAINAIPRS
jgi:predicted nucleic acid binding AN1-type Zn finger protein